MKRSNLVAMTAFLALSLYSWEMPQSSMPRMAGHNIRAAAVQPDHGFSGEVTGGDPFTQAIPAGIPKVRYMVVDMSVNGNAGSSFQCSVNLGSKTNPVIWLELPVTTDGSLQRYTVDLSTHKNYPNITAFETFRLDPIDVGKAGDTFTVNRLWFTDEPAKLPRLSRKTDYTPVIYDFSAESPSCQPFLTGGHNLLNRTIANGCLSATIGGDDPYFPAISVNRPLKEINRLTVTMAATTQSKALQLFLNLGFKTTYSGIALVPDGQFHSYTFALDKIMSNAEDLLHNFRLDPVDPAAAGDTIRIRSIALTHSDLRDPLPLAAVIPPAGHGKLVVPEFRQVSVGGTASCPTTVQMDYDADGITIDTASGIENADYVANGKKTNDPVYNDDSLEFFFMPTPDMYYQVVVNPDGVTFSHRVEMDGELSGAHHPWNHSAEIKSTIIPGTWKLRLKLPFSALGLNGVPSTPVLVSIVRNSVADGKGISAWNFYRGLNAQVGTFRKLIFGQKPSPAITLKTPGNLFPGKNAAVFSNPDGKSITARITLRSCTTGLSRTFSVTGAEKELLLPYVIDVPGKFEMITSAGDEQSSYYSDYASFEAVDPGAELENLVKDLKRIPPFKTIDSLYRQTLSIGEAFMAQYRTTGQLDMMAYKDFRRRCDALRCAARREDFRKATARRFSMADVPLALAQADSMLKVFPSFSQAVPPFRGTELDTLSLEAAGNDSEGIQLVLIGLDKPVGSLSLTFESKTFPVERLHAYTIDTIDTTGMKPKYNVSYMGRYPEIMIPGLPKKLDAHEIRSLFLRADVPFGFQPGSHDVTAVLTADGTVFRIPMSIRVWSFSLPKIPILRTAMSCTYTLMHTYYKALQNGKDLTSEQKTAMEDRLVRMMLRYRMNPGYIYDWTSYSGKPIPFPPPQYLKEYAELGMNAIPISNLTPRSFTAPGEDLRNYYNTNNRKETLLKSMIANYAMAKKLGLEKLLYLHGFDEVGYHRDLKGKAEVIRDLFTYWQKSIPELRLEVITTVVPSLVGVVNIWCPAMNVLAKEHESFMERKAAGDELWTYGCLGSPEQGYPPSFVLESEAIDMRLIGWICSKYKSDGFLYYSMLRWDHNLPKDGVTWPERPWNPVHIGGYNGEANFIYPAPSFTQEPYPSIRLENLRDGFEDYDMLAMLRRVREKATPEDQKRIDALSDADTLMTDCSHYTQEPERLRNLRREAAALLEKYTADKR